MLPTRRVDGKFLHELAVESRRALLRAAAKEQNPTVRAEIEYQILGETKK